ncbi:prepilin peptidase [Halorussus limi]|uniref:Prepilin peptidase n=1 Tax=Halorussus limi TaxID=2938695 RepID=A0A8U0I0F3_9EURY|nr:A24 family peptidase [Halorussus limi]UPV76294.1 prepilin peptidase [Halorussus limi]
MDASIPDLLRLLVVPVFGWAALRDVKTRRVPNRTWYPLAALAVVLLAVEGWQAWTGTAYETRAFALRTAISLGFVAPLVVAFWWFRAFGGADAKAFLVVAALFPTFPTYEAFGWVLPHQRTAVGVFSLTILTNTVLLGALYPLAVLGRNAVAGRFSSVMVVGKPVSWRAAAEEHGRLLETPEGVTRNGVDLDAVRMYLRWRGLTLAELRERPDRFRDPATLPAEPNPPGDGSVGVEDLRADGGELEAPAETVAEEDAPADDPWGAAAFLDDIDHGAYGTTPEGLRDGLDVLVSAEEVWVSPGIPFVVPLFVGTVVALTYGDMLFGAMAVFGLA